MTAQPALCAADSKPRFYHRVQLVDQHRRPLKAPDLAGGENYLFHYPFEATPAFLLDLGKPALPQSLSTKDRGAYSWPGGVGPKRSIVAFSAICAHQLVYPTREVSFISFRKTRAQRGVLASERQKALGELDRLKKQIEAGKKAIADLEEEARRANVPPGWLR